MASVNVGHRYIHILESETVKDNGIKKKCAAVAGMAIVGQNQDLYYLKYYPQKEDEPEEKQPMVLSRLQDWLYGKGTTTHKVIKKKKSTDETYVKVKATHANGLTYYRKPGDSTGLFYIATRNHVKGKPKSVNDLIGPQVIAVTKDGIVKKEIYYSEVINSIAYYDTDDGYPRFLIGVGVDRSEENESAWVEYRYHLVKLVGNTFRTLIKYNAPRIEGYREGNDIYCNDGKLYVTVIKKAKEEDEDGKYRSYVIGNKIVPINIESYDVMASEDNPPVIDIPESKKGTALIDNRDDKYDKGYEIEGMSIHSNEKKYVCTNRVKGDKSKRGDWVCQLYKKNG